MTQKEIMTELDILKKNVADLQLELNKAYKRIAELNEQIIALQREQSVNLGQRY
jgi:hypothetical protein